MYETREESSKVAGSMVDSKFSNIETENVVGKKAGFDYSYLNEYGLIKENTKQWKTDWKLIYNNKFNPPKDLIKYLERKNWEFNNVEHSPFDLLNTAFMDNGISFIIDPKTIDAPTKFDKLVDIIAQLREECPWDKEQSHVSLSKHLLEEAYELLDSLAKLNNNNQESYRNLSSELGDLLLQILLHSKIASENGYFSIVEVVDSLNEKLIKRHPHVFGDVSLDSPKEVEKQWEKIKQEDKQSIFDDINNNLPAITTAFKAQRKAESLNLT